MQTLVKSGKEYTLKKRDIKLIKEGACNLIYTVNLNNEEWYLKSDNGDSVPMRASDFEVFASFLLKRVLTDKYNKDILDYEYAKVKKSDISGCISKSFLNENDKLLLFISIYTVEIYNKENGTNYKYDDFLKNRDMFESFYYDVYTSKEYAGKRTNMQFNMSVQHIVKSMEDYITQKGLKCNLKKLEFDLEKMVICDYFISNYDRNFCNISFVVNENNELYLSPNFDNGLSNGAIWDCYEERYKKNIKYGHCPLIDSKVTLSTDGETVDFSGNKLFSNKGIMAIEIYEMTKQSPIIKQVVDNFVNCDLEQCFIDFAREKGCELNEEQKERIKLYYNKKREMYLSKVQRLKSKLKNKEIEREM